MSLLSGRRILLGVTGSIAAFKAADLASKLTQAGAEVDCILTASAERFVTGLTFQSLTGRRAYVEQDLWADEGHILHVGLAQTAALLVIAPATADTIAKLVHGRANTLLTLTALAATCPVIVAPA
ncbi:MAG: bifunctional 4'-phosphopantothenoylcysteine decarboxylase/phosphopantothenoylcysteine synthetase, partial [Chloroflexi bacterium]|nr:bifunctional 4'-phosphopantothenoylcysteine decarboxylase/phosphopantothenoylcysteine synthetase [Chloroflexota bacterium]MCI0876706.1 bifunctional 4'-phosphopantothenoylcysteine decarboxylase/phosphopantothenoylcysteine synthetase [Chloroflexota bacterium]